MKILSQILLFVGVSMLLFAAIVLLWEYDYAKEILELEAKRQTVKQEQDALATARMQWAEDIEAWNENQKRTRAKSLQHFVDVQGEIRGFPPALLFSIIWQESRFDENAFRYEKQNRVSRGCAQFLNEYELFYSKGTIFDPYDCFQAVTILAEWIEGELEKERDIRNILIYYNGGNSRSPQSIKYAEDVLARAARLAKKFR